MKFIQTIHHYDVSVFTWVRQRKSRKMLVRCARYISRTGDGPCYLLLAVGLLLSRGADEMRLLTCMGLALLMERPLYFLIKNCCKRDRPPAALNIKSFIVPSDRFSFPSGHTSAAFLMATLVGWYYPMLSPFLLAWAVTIGMARVILGVHFPTDTLIGAVMGTATALLSMEMILA
ncbi:MAG: phosphatase PAP2 family protein [Methylococcaceae bacterium]|nr:phosphatase PAP2 family protein [Methylococcaceae bacterium]